MMLDVIGYIRSLFAPRPTKRKRSAIDNYEDLLTPTKHRKLSPRFPEDGWVMSNKPFTSRNTQMESKLKNTSIIVLDDDSDEVTPNGNVSKTKPPISSTPYTGNSLLKFSRDLNGSNTSKYFTPEVATQNLLPVASTSKKSEAATDFAFRLDEKRKYRQLLHNSSKYNSGLLSTSFAGYYTPLSKTALSRAKKLVELGKYEASKQTNKTATSETILKVLDDLDDVVVIKDSDSDVEIVPNPPSPKPDIKVERVNSLRQLASSCKPLRQDWITDKVLKHRQEVQKYVVELESRQSKLAELRRINEEIQREQLEKQVEKCLHIKDAVLPVEEKSAFPVLTDKQEQMVVAALDKRGGSNTALANKFNLTILRRDMQTLAGLNWLNDEVINFYMNLLIERGKLQQWPAIYAFNTFFYPKILKDGQQSVRRWTRKVDVFAHDLLCVPIHLGMHWCMAIVDMRTKTVSYYDSMGKSNPQCTDAIFKYLQDEHTDKKGSPFDTQGWKLQSVRNIPQQMNGSDCGMFSCTYAEFATRNAPFTFSQEDMPYLRRKMVVEIMTGQLLIQ